MEIFLIILLIVIGAVILFGLLPAAILGYILYSYLLVRDKPGKWGRECSLPEDKEYKSMFDIGSGWYEKNKSLKQEVSITSCGFRLVGEYYDFGFDKAVIIIPGRTESLLYSYFFAEPYQKSGHNVLVIDNRSHGLSEGKRCCLGYSEYKDIIGWSRLLHETFGVKSVVLHGICIGSSVALFAATAPECPEYITAMVAEGMYASFSESLKNHIIELKKPLFPVYQSSMLMMRIFSGADVVNDGPLYRIDALKKPILFLHSREDAYSAPEKAEEIYKKCSAPKKIVWFPTGAHSRLRINHTEKYDREIIDFLEEHEVVCDPVSEPV